MEPRLRGGTGGAGGARQPGNAGSDDELDEGGAARAAQIAAVAVPVGKPGGAFREPASGHGPTNAGAAEVQGAALVPGPGRDAQPARAGHEPQRQNDRTGPRPAGRHVPPDRAERDR